MGETATLKRLVVLYVEGLCVAYAQLVSVECLDG